jgi:hypothetical protein
MSILDESIPLTEDFLYNYKITVFQCMFFGTSRKERSHYKRKYNRSINRFMRR